MAKFTWLVTEPRLNEIVVNKPPIGRKTHSVAKSVGAKAEAVLAGHRRTGAAKIEVKRGTKRVDAFVTLSDESGDRAAAAIEFGHINNRTGNFVQGLAPLRKGIASVR